MENSWQFLVYCEVAQASDETAGSERNPIMLERTKFSVAEDVPNLETCSLSFNCLETSAWPEFGLYFTTGGVT